MLFAALIGPYFIDWSSYRQDFEREAGRILGQQVRVQGAAEARLLPFPSVTFGNVVVGEGEDGQPMMEIERFSMDVELAPFLSGEIRIFDMRIEKPRATVRLSGSGELDWALRSEKSLPSQPIILENITVTDGYVTIVDEQNGRRHVAENLDLIMSAKSVRGPWHVAGSGRFDGYGGTINLTTGLPKEDGSLRLRSQISPDGLPISIELEGDAGIRNLKPQYTGTFSAQTLERKPGTETGDRKGGRARQPLEARVQGQFQLDNARLRIPEYRLQTGPRDNPYIISGEATFDTGTEPEFLLTADGQQVNFNLLAQDDQSLADFVSSRSFQQRMSDFRRMIDLVPVPNMPGKVSMAIPAIVAGDTTFREIFLEASPDVNSWKLEKLSAKLPGRTTFEAEGTLGVGNDFGFTGDMLIASNQPSGFASWLSDSVDPSIRRLDAAGLSARVDLSPRLQRFDDLEVVVGDTVLHGQLQRSVLRLARPSITIELTADEIDYDAVRALAALVTSSGNDNILAGHDIEKASLRAERLDIAGVSAGQVNVSMRLSDGTLEIDQLNVDDLAGAWLTMTGDVENVFDTPVVHINPTILADDMRGLSPVLSEIFGDVAIVDQIRRRAPYFENTRIDIEAWLKPREGGGTDLSANVSGYAGGSQIYDTEIEKGNVLAPFDAGPLSVKVNARNPSSRKLLAQLGMDVPTLLADGEATVELRAGSGAEGRTDFDVAYSAADIGLQAGGQLWHDEERQVLGDFDLKLKTEDLSPYLLSYGYGYDSALLSLPIDLSGHVAVRPDAFAVSTLAGTVDDIAISGSLSASRGREDVAIGGSLGLSELDLGYAGEMLLGPQVFASPDGGWDDTGFKSSLPSDLSLEIAVTADKAGVPFGFDLTDFKGMLVLEGNELQLRDLDAAWGQGKVEGSVNLSNLDGSGILSGQIGVSGLDLSGHVWSGEDDIPVASGKLDVSASVEGSGKTMADLVASLTGSGVVTAHDLELQGVAGDALPVLMSRADQEGFEAEAGNVAALTRAVVPSGTFHTAEVTAPFTLAAGVLRMSNIRLTDEDATMTGDARIDLPTSSLEAGFRVEYDPGLDALTGAAPAFEMTFDGDFASPERGWNMTEMTNFLSLRAYERERRRVEMLQAVVLEKQRMRREVALARDYFQRQQRLREAERQREAARRAAQEEERRQEQQRIQEEMQRQEEERERQRAAEQAAAETERARSESESTAPSNVPVPGDKPQGTGSAGTGVPLFDDLYRRLDKAINPDQ